MKTKLSTYVRRVGSNGRSAAHSGRPGAFSSSTMTVMITATTPSLNASRRPLLTRVRSELCAVDHEAVLHVALEGSLVRLIDLVRGDHFDVARDAVRAAVIEHRLSLGNA